MMEQALQLFEIFLILLLGSIGLSYLFFFMKSRLKGEGIILMPLPNSVARIRGKHSLHRTVFLEETEEGWVFGVSSHTSFHVPLKPGEVLVVEAISFKGRVLFHSEVLKCLTDLSAYVIKKPKQTYRCIF